MAFDEVVNTCQSHIRAVASFFYLGSYELDETSVMLLLFTKKLKKNNNCNRDGSESLTPSVARRHVNKVDS